MAFPRCDDDSDWEEQKREEKSPAKLITSVESRNGFCLLLASSVIDDFRETGKMEIPTGGFSHEKCRKTLLDRENILFGFSSWPKKILRVGSRGSNDPKN